MILYRCSNRYCSVCLKQSQHDIFTQLSSPTQSVCVGWLCTGAELHPLASFSGYMLDESFCERLTY